MVRLPRFREDPIQIPMMVGLGLMTGAVFLRSASLIYAGSICIIGGAIWALLTRPDGPGAADGPDTTEAKPW